MEYCLASALVRGRCGMPEFTADAVSDLAVRAVIPRIQVRGHPDLKDTVAYCTPALLEVDTADGRTLKTFARVARGHPGRPLEFADLERKYRDCAGPVLEPRAASRSLELLQNLEDLPDVRFLMHELTSVARTQRSVGGR